MISTEWIYAIVSVLCAGLLAFSATPAVRVLAFKINAIDRAKDGRRTELKYSESQKAEKKAVRRSAKKENK